MAVLDKNLNTKILASAKEEFLAKGFEKASLREICKNAGVSTGAVYTRYKGKEELFGVLVKDVLDKIDAMFVIDESNSGYFSKNDGTNYDMSWILSNIALEPLVHFIYDNYDGFRLLINCSNGSVYSDFMHSFVDRSQDAILYFFEHTSLMKVMVDKEELHLMITTYWSAIFEVIKHDFSREKAISYCNVLSQFFNWKSICSQ